MIVEREFFEKSKRVARIYSEALLLTGEPLDVCDEIVRWIADLLDIEYAFIEKIDGESFEVISSVQNGVIKRGEEFPLIGTPCKDVQIKKETCIHLDVADAFPEDAFLTDEEIKYYCGVPIFDHVGDVIGVLNALGKQNRSVNSDDIELLELLAKRASLELEHLRRDLESKKLQKNLLEIGQEIIEHHDVDEILRRVADGIQIQSPFSLVAISLYDFPIDPLEPARESISKVVLGGLSEEDESKLKNLAESGKFITAHQIVTKGKMIGGGYLVQPDMIPDLIETSIKGSLVERGNAEWGPYDDYFIFLQYGDKIIGRISLGDPLNGQLPSEEELEPLKLFSNLASLALDKAIRLEQLKAFQTRLEGIYKWNEQLANCDDLDEMSNVAVQVMVEMFNYDHVSLFRNEGATLDLIGFHTRLDISEYKLDQFNAIAVGDGIVGQVANSRAPILCGDVNSHKGYISGHSKIRSEIAAPILDDGDLLAVLNIESTEPNAFGDDDLKLLTALASQLALTIRGIERRQEVEWINQFLQGLNRTSNLQDTLELIIQRGIEMLAPKADAGALLLWNANIEAFEFAVSVNRDLEVLKEVKIALKGEFSQIFNVKKPVILSQDMQNGSSISASFVEVQEDPPAATIALPIHSEDQLIAVLCLNNLNEAGVFADRDTERLWNLVSEIELALARATDHEELRQMAMHDALTSTYNRHFFSEYVDKERHDELLKDAPISLVMVDIDDFYEVNDRFGHAEGDRVLQQVAQLIRDEVRKNDIVVRYGGDEFIIIMPETNDRQADSVMERLRAQFEKWKPDVPELRLSISFGVASWDPNGNESLVEVLEKADLFMYHRRQKRSDDRRVGKHAVIGATRGKTSSDS